MAPLQLPNIAPFPQLSQQALPLALAKALKNIFSEVGEKVWLVGGTALAGFYAEHRRSDDLDLFAGNEVAYKGALHAVRSLKNKGAIFLNESTSPLYYHALIKFLDHQFTLDIVLDKHLHRVGKGIKAKDNIWVADINTLLATKIGTLVSRCSEKDLFDLDWFLGQIPEYKIENLIEIGNQIDAGLNLETLLISLQGAILKKEACHFLLPHSPITVDQAYNKITTLQKTLIQKLLDYQKNLPLSQEAKDIKQTLKDFKKIK